MNSINKPQKCREIIKQCGALNGMGCKVGKISLEGLLGWQFTVGERLK
jgi:hypothetical protein